jgi:tRNA uridine 5-carbamoylmethylation protein Kti12
MFRDHRRPGRLILICGLPGAGKTTFANPTTATLISFWTR